MLLSSVGLTAGTLLFSCGRVDGEETHADGTGGFVGNPKGCWYDYGGYDDCGIGDPPRGGAGGTPPMNGEAGCAAGAGPGGDAGFGGDAWDED